MINFDLMYVAFERLDSKEAFENAVARWEEARQELETVLVNLWFNPCIEWMKIRLYLSRN